MPALAENQPLGVQDWVAPPRDPVCPACHARLLLERHESWCRGGEPLVRFMDVSGDPKVQRLEELLSRCTARAHRAWLAAGRRP